MKVNTGDDMDGITADFVSVQCEQHVAIVLTNCVQTNDESRQRCEHVQLSESQRMEQFGSGIHETWTMGQRHSSAAVVCTYLTS
jgi:hypothetical protein